VVSSQDAWVPRRNYNLTSPVNNDHHNHGGPQPTPAEMPPKAPHEALRPEPLSSLDGWRPPELADTIFKGLRGCMALITLRLRWCIISGTKERCEGHTPHQHPQNYTRLLGGSSPINLTRRNEAQCLVWGKRGAFPQSVAMVVMVFCSLLECEPLFLVALRHIGYRQEALVSSKAILALYWGVEIKEKRR
jgi:hypothetical protein